MLEKIKNSKYPAISVEEESISIPLQTMCQAVFDSILIHMLNTVSPSSWHGIKKSMIDSLNDNKNGKLAGIMEASYEDVDVWFLQEVAAMFIEDLKNTPIAKAYDFLIPEKLDGKRDQNSIILVKKGKFDGSSAVEVTAQVSAHLSEGCPVAAGDLFACTINSLVWNEMFYPISTYSSCLHVFLRIAFDYSKPSCGVQGEKFLLASFHGDTNGLATVPVLEAVCKFQSENEECKLLFGLDANTYKKHKEGKNQGVTEFTEFFRSKKLNSTWVSCFCSTNSRAGREPKSDSTVITGSKSRSRESHYMQRANLSSATTEQGCKKQ